METTAESGRRLLAPDRQASRPVLGESLNSFCWAIACVWRRYFDVYRKNLFYALVTTFAEPILYCLSFGFGLGALVGDVHLDGGRLVTYRQFILSGILAQSVMFQGFFEAAYGGFIRMYYQRIFKAMAMTPITLGEVLIGELWWDATKGVFSAVAVLGLGVALGDFSPLGAVLLLPICFLGALLFAGLGLWVAALAPTIEAISYPQYLIVFPMFLFCGVYFPLGALPHFLQIVVWCLPLTPLVVIARGALLGAPCPLIAFPLFLGWTLVLTCLSHRVMTGRLVK